MEYYKKLNDVQTLAMLVVLFWDRRYFTSLPIPLHGIRKSASKASLDYVPANVCIYANKKMEIETLKY